MEVNTRTLREQLGERIAALAGVDFSGPIVEREEPHTTISPRHPEARHRASVARPGGASKGDGPRPTNKPGRPSFEGRLRRPPQDDGSKKGVRAKKKWRPR